MRDWVNFKVQQFNDDAYLKNELSTLDNQTVKYTVSSLHSCLYKGESAKELETYIVQLLKREYAKNLALLIDSNKFIYCNNMADVLSFTKYYNR